MTHRGGLTQSEVLPLGRFAVTGDWPPDRLAEGTRHAAYRLADAQTLLDAGFLIWPTSVYVDDVPDPRDEVHYDLIVDHGPHLCQGPG